MHNLSGHLGIRKTYHKIKNRYFWDKFRRDVREYCKSCGSCQINKPRRNKAIAQAATIPFLRPFEILHIDICVSFPVTERNNKHIIVAVDRLSKYVVAKAIPDQTAITAARHVYENIITVFGPYRYIVSDLGSCFISEIFENLQIFCTPASHLYTISYHASSNGAVERQNSSIKASLRTVCDGNYDSWDLQLPGVIYALNTSYNVDLEMNPYQFLFHLKPRTNLDLMISPDILYAGNTPDLYSEKALKNWEKVVEKTRNRLTERAVKRAQKKNEHSRKQCFLIGDIVVLKNIAVDLINPGPFKPKYKGIYLIIKQCSPSVYCIQKLYNPEKRKKVSVEQLELYHKRHPEFNLDETNFRFLTDIPKSIPSCELLDYNKYVNSQPCNLPSVYDLNTEKTDISNSSDQTVLYTVPP